MQTVKNTKKSSTEIILRCTRDLYTFKRMTYWKEKKKNCIVSSRVLYFAIRQKWETGFISHNIYDLFLDPIVYFCNTIFLLYILVNIDILCMPSDKHLLYI